MKKQAAEENVTIKAPSIVKAEFEIVGTAPYIQLRFSEKAIHSMMEKHKAGSQGNKRKAKEARDFDADFVSAGTFISIVSLSHAITFSGICTVA